MGALQNWTMSQPRLVEINEQQKKELWESFNLLDPEGTG